MKRLESNATLWATVLLLAIAVNRPVRGAADAVVWRLEEPKHVGGQVPAILGAPRAVVEDGVPALRFGGAADGLIFAANPLRGWRAFTIEVRFKPDADGPEAQRFVHVEDAAENRALIETRVVAGGNWYLDTYLFSKPNAHGVTLVEKANLHPCGRWYWAALVYDGKSMTHFVDAKPEREGALAFGPMTDGRTSVGVRLNQVFWFKGAIAEVRFHPRPLRAAELQRAR